MIIQKERRLSDRIADSSYLIVRGINSKGTVFTEITQVNDVSANGISFLLRNPVAVNCLLDISIGEIDETIREFNPAYIVKVRVVTIFPLIKANPFSRIGAVFEGEVRSLKPDMDPEKMARQLQSAILQDKNRH